MESNDAFNKANNHKKEHCAPHHPFGPHRPPRHNPLVGGIIIVIVGLALLLKKTPAIGPYLPDWLFTWPMILILIGIAISIKSRTIFRGGLLILIGLFFLLNNNHVFNISLQPYALPILVIIFGLLMIFRRKQARKRWDYWRQRREYMHQFHQRQNIYQRHSKPDSNDPAHEYDSSNTDNNEVPSDDYLNVQSIFGGTQKNCYSKKFTGGNILCVFGGSKINLTQADMKRDVAVLDLSINLGGAQIGVPANWKIQNDLNVLFGGIEDKRFIRDEEKQGPSKLLILRGYVLCGGVEIRT